MVCQPDLDGNGGLAVLVVLVLIVMAVRGGGTTIVKE
jgi:hypothetical protein